MKKRKNEIYENYFEFERITDGKVAYCKNCEPMKEIKMKNSNTSGLIKHLQNTHFDIYKEVMKDRPVIIRDPRAAKRMKKIKLEQNVDLFDSQEFNPPKSETNNLKEYEPEPQTENEGSDSAGYLDPLLYQEENQAQVYSESILSPGTVKESHECSSKHTQDIVKYLLEKQLTQDDSDIQGKSWASQYRQLSTEQQLRVKKKIDDILYEARIENLNSSRDRRP